MSERESLGFLGTGKMATALACGFLRAGLVSSGQMLGSDPLASARDGFARETGAGVTGVNAEVVDRCATLFLAAKPDQVPDVLREIGPGLTGDHLVVSIAAGVTLTKLERQLPRGIRVVRTMPNTPALVGASATAYALGRAARPEDGAWVQRLFSAVGLAMEVKEALLDGVTGLSGSGPAYAFKMIEALSDGGVAVGLPREIATRLAAQTLLGAARLVLETGQHPAALKDMVTSPGGTTIEGLQELDKAAVSAALISAVRAASAKATKLSE